VPTWGEILVLLKQSAAARGGQPDFDGIRRAFLGTLFQLTTRPCIIYYTDWLAGGSPESAITLEDMQAMMEVCNGVPGPELDRILHTPGGSAEATASIVGYLRQKFTDIRVFVPVAAMSAGTMWSFAGNKIVMGKHSQLGPIDPQLLVGDRYVPTRAIVEQFDRAKDEIEKNPATLAAWYPILQQYGPGLLAECEDAEALARRLAGEWLAGFMFAGDGDADKKAQAIADFFADYTTHRSHSLGISRLTAASKGLRVENLEDDQALQDAVLSVHHATMHTFAGPAIKIVENHLGRAFVKVAQEITIAQQMPMPVPVPPGVIPLAPQQPQPPQPPAGP